MSATPRPPPHPWPQTACHRPAVMPTRWRATPRQRFQAADRCGISCPQSVRCDAHCKYAGGLRPCKTISYRQCRLSLRESLNFLFCSVLERENGIHRKCELPVLITAIKRQTDRAGGAVIPVPTALGPDHPIAIRSPVQTRGDGVEIAREAAAVPSEHARDVPGARDADAVVVAQPLRTEVGRPASIERVQQVLVDAVPLHRVAGPGGILFRAQSRGPARTAAARSAAAGRSGCTPTDPGRRAG